MILREERERSLERKLNIAHFLCYNKQGLLKMHTPESSFGRALFLFIHRWGISQSTQEPLPAIINHWVR